MARKVITALKTQEVEEQFNLVEKYIAKKQELEKLDKEVKKLSELVKEQMKNDGLNTVESNGFKVIRIESERITWKEDLLLAKVKTYNKPELIKQVEQVDVPVLEQCVLDGVIDVNDLQDCQTVTRVVSLRMNKIKEKQSDDLCATE